MPRQPYARTSQLDRDRLITAFDNDQDYHVLAQQLGIGRQTARSIIIAHQNHQRNAPLPRGGARRRKLTEEMLDLVIHCVEENPLVTLEALRLKLLQAFPNNGVSRQTISNHLDGQMYTVKMVRTVTVAWNTPATKNLRAAYAAWLMQEGMQQRLVYCDEFGFNVWTARTQGRARRGCRAVRIVNAQRGENLSICVAIDSHAGVLHYKLVRGGFNAALFGEFAVELDIMADGEPFTLVLDNARPHLNLPEVQYRVQYLPVYSPFLNAAEYVGSAMKAAVKARLSLPEVQGEIAQAEEGEPLYARRMRILRREVVHAVDNITREMCNQCCLHVLEYVPRCMTLEDIVD